MTIRVFAFRDPLESDAESPFVVGVQLDQISLPSVGVGESGGCKQSSLGRVATDPLRLLIAIEVADLIRIPFLVEVLDAVVAKAGHLFGDLALEAPAGVLA